MKTSFNKSQHNPKTPWLVCTLFFVICSAFLWFVTNETAALNEIYRQEKAAHQSINKQLLDLPAQKINAENYSKMLATLHENNWVFTAQQQGEQLLNWQELLQNIAETFAIPHFEFSMTEARLVTENTAPNAINAAINVAQKTDENKPEDAIKNTSGFYKNTLQLEMEVLHEGDLFDVLNALKTRANALIIPRRCALSRLEPPTELANLSAICTIDFVTFIKEAAP